MAGAKESAHHVYEIPESTLYAAFSGTGEPVFSPALTDFLQEKSIPVDVLKDAVADMPEGAWPLILGDCVLLSCTARFSGSEGIVFLRSVSRVDLCRFLDTCYSGDRMLLTDVTGRILASSTSFETGM